MTERGLRHCGLQEFILTRHRQIRELEIAGYVESRLTNGWTIEFGHVDDTELSNIVVGVLAEAIFAFCPRLGSEDVRRLTELLWKLQQSMSAVSSREQRARRRA